MGPFVVSLSLFNFKVWKTVVCQKKCKKIGKPQNFARVLKRPQLLEIDKGRKGRQSVRKERLANKDILYMLIV